MLRHHVENRETPGIITTQATDIGTIKLLSALCLHTEQDIPRRVNVMDDIMSVIDSGSAVTLVALYISVAFDAVNTPKSPTPKAG